MFVKAKCHYCLKCQWLYFDEGHLLEFAAQKAFTYEIQSETLIRLLERVMVDGVREKTLNLMEVFTGIT